MAKQTIQANVILDDTVLVVSELVGEHAMPIIEFLTGKEKISEFIIAEEIEQEINQVRGTLYQLLEHNIVSFIRKKDRIKGWYICYWDFNEYMIPQLKKKMLQNKLDRLQERLAEESSAQFYICGRTCTRLTFEEAMDQNFKCAECGSILQEQDNTRTKEFLAERINELDEQISVLK